MRFVIVTLVLLFFGSSCFAIKYRSASKKHYSRVDNTILHYGYTVGFGVFDYTVKNSHYGGVDGFLADPVKFSSAFYLGVIGEWNITDYVSLRTVPSFYFGERTITYNRPETLTMGRNKLTDLGYPLSIDAEVQSVYFSVPLLLKYRGIRAGNYNFYLLGGLSRHIDLTPHHELKPKKNWIIRTNKHDVAIELGGGADFYLMYFRLGIELRISIGLFDMINHNVLADQPNYEIYTKTIDKMKSTMITLAFNFE